jgi:glycosyltransferase involved in cell wall biosynthesis
MKNYLRGQFTVIVIDKQDLFLEKALHSIEAQDLQAKRIILISSRSQKDLLPLLTDLTVDIVVERIDDMTESKALKRAFDLAQTEFACVLRANERFLSTHALTELNKVFQMVAEVEIVSPDFSVVNSLGEKLYDANYHDRFKELQFEQSGVGNLFQYDLLRPEILKGGGRGIAFRIPETMDEGIFNLEFGLLGFLMRLVFEGKFAYIPKALITINQENILPHENLRDLWLKLYKNLYIQNHNKFLSIEVLSVASFYHSLLANYGETRVPFRIFHFLLAKIFHPLPWIKKFFRYIALLGLHCLVHFLSAFGKIAFHICYPKLFARDVFDRQKIGFVSHVLPPSPSGQSVVIERILREMDKESYELIQTRPFTKNNNLIDSLPGKTVIVSENIPAEKFYKNTFLFFCLGIIKAFIRGYAVARVVFRKRCGVLLGCTGDLFDPPATYFAGQFLKSKLYFYYFDDYRYQWVDKKRRKFSALFEELFFRAADGFVVPNEFMQQELLARCFVDTRIVRNPTDDIEEKQKYQKKPINEKKQIIYTGSVYHVNVEAIKNVLRALEILDHDDIKLHIYSLQSEEALRQYGIWGNYVEYHSHVPPEDIVRIQENADLLLIPFSFESSVPEVIKTSAPGKLGDYLASGTPILAHVPEDSFVNWFLCNNHCGITVTVNDPNAVAAAIEKNLYLGSPPKQLIQNAEMIAQREFGRQKAAGDFSKFVLSQPQKDLTVLHVSATDLGGQQFNGYLLGKGLQTEDIQSYMSIAYGQSNSPSIFKYGYGAYGSYLNRFLRFAMEELSLQSVYPTYSMGKIFPKKMFDKIEIIHLQLFHAAPFFNLNLLPDLAKHCPLVCTVHDQWLYTGHCVHPLECQGWLSGCKHCPDLVRNIPMKHDRAAYMWHLKKQIFQKTEIQLVVSSRWMYERVKKSPLVSHLPCEIIPFGVDTDIFFPEAKRTCRREFDIPENHKVIAFRSAPQNFYKGNKHIIEALGLLESKNITLLTLDKTGALEFLRDRYNIVDLGWTNNQSTLRKFFSAADVFLSPSIAESFGLMPLEAMACGTPVIVFQDTVLEETTHSPQVGIAVPYRNSEALKQAIQELFENPNRLDALGKKSAELVLSEYTFHNYVKKHAELYRKLVKNQHG